MFTPRCPTVIWKLVVASAGKEKGEEEKGEKGGWGREKCRRGRKR